MIKEKPFDEHLERYEEWFERHESAYRSELKAVREMVPSEGEGLEVGVGSGRFAGPLSIKKGIDPSLEMLKGARERGIEVIKGVGERLPFRNKSFDHILIVTTICFFDDAERALKECRRVLKDGGKIMIGFIDKKSYLGKLYEKKKEKNVFYREATFFSFNEVKEMLSGQKFKDISSIHTLFERSVDHDGVEPFKEGHGEGSFVVVSARK